MVPVEGARGLHDEPVASLLLVTVVAFTVLTTGAAFAVIYRTESGGDWSGSPVRAGVWPYAAVSRLSGRPVAPVAGQKEAPCQ